jgi:asparagine synthase (glutamine-hydrolysing)
MCGINGIFAYHYAANPVDPAELTRTRDHMAARGPDGKGEWIAPDRRIGFGHRRLSIIDLSSAAAQPMASADGKLVVTYNGEAYNHRELRSQLEARGRTFRTQSDTEVLLHLYAEKGADMVHDLRGMFAFAIWDAERRSLFLARDPYGIKPLYYSDDGWTFRFASQVKALVAGGTITKDPDPAGVTGFFLFGSVPEPFTTHHAVRSLPAGTTLKVDRAGTGSPARYHSIAACYRRGDTGPAPSGPAQASLRQALLDSVKCHLVADVPVGAFLSAGIDSGALVGLMRDAGAVDVQTITVGFEEFAGKPSDESQLARKVAAHYGTRHTTRMVSRAEFEADLPPLIDAMDQPSIDGVNTWLVSKAAHELGLKVAISGLGGDELLGGYASFRDVPRWVRAFALPSRLPLLGRVVREIGSRLASAVGANPKAAGLVELGGTTAGAYLLKRGLFMPWELASVLPRDVVSEGLRRLAPINLLGAALQPRPPTAFGQVATLESAFYMRNQLLRDADWASMAHSIEVRVPLVDCALLSAFAPLAGAFGERTGKELLATAPSRPLPEQIVRRPKTGFTTPVETWMQERARAGRPLTATPSRAPWARDWSRVVRDLSRAVA